MKKKRPLELKKSGLLSRTAKIRKTICLIPIPCFSLVLCLDHFIGKSAMVVPNCLYYFWPLDIATGGSKINWLVK